ncbi:MAG: hypothetical protein M1833_004092 [Piccolia ochrophora]|nr:MAG: hypothetical protein M1833_004092 [Piccolia ochrophora]
MTSTTLPSHAPSDSASSSMAPPPTTTTTTTSPASPQIHTYHHLCTQLLLTTTLPLTHFPRRAPPALDGAYMIPLASPSSPSTSTSGAGAASASYNILLSVARDRKPVVVRREDGFEKRLVSRCGRCRGVVGYAIVGRAEGERDGEGDGEGEVVYLLPGGWRESGDLGRRVGEGEVGFGEGGEGGDV